MCACVFLRVGGQNVSGKQWRLRPLAFPNFAIAVRNVASYFVSLLYFRRAWRILDLPYRPANRPADLPRGSIGSNLLTRPYSISQKSTFLCIFLSLGFQL